MKPAQTAFKNIWANISKTSVNVNVFNYLELTTLRHYDQFLLLPQCFQKSSTAEASEIVCMWEKDN